MRSALGECRRTLAQHSCRFVERCCDRSTEMSGCRKRLHRQCQITVVGFDARQCLCQRIACVEPIEHDVQLRVPDVRKARKVLDFEATTTLDQMLDEVIPWIRVESDAGRL